MRLRYFGVLALLSCTLLSACATTTAMPDRIDLSNAKLGANRIGIVDARPPSAWDYRVVESGGTYRFMGDNSIQPVLLEILSARLADAIPPQYRETRIEVLRLDVGLWRDSVDSPRSIATIYQQGMSTPAVVGAAAIGYGVSYAIQGLRAREAAVANFELNVGGYSVTSIDAIPLKGDLSTAQVLERAIRSGLRTVEEKVSAMQYWAIPYKKE
jgi:hypothetical protein